MANGNPKKYLLQTCQPLDWGDCGSMLKAVVGEPEIKQHKHGKQSYYVTWSSNVQLSDCSRAIEWDFQLDYEEGRGPNVAKAEELLKWATALRDALAKARAKYDKAQAECKLRNEREERLEKEEFD